MSEQKWTNVLSLRSQPMFPGTTVRGNANTAVTSVVFRMVEGVDLIRMG